MALELAEGGDEGAIAALMTILLGMRCSEIVTRKVFDVDEEDEPGDLIHIPDEDAKSDGGTLEVPEDLRAFLVRLTIGKKPDDYLFPARSKTGAHWRDWPRKQVQRICRLAGVKEVSAHAMRGALATIALRRGTAPSAVQETLRHKDIKTTTGSYAERGAAEQGERVRGLHLLKGGKR